SVRLAKAPPGTATATWPGSSAKPLSAPPEPIPSSANATADRPPPRQEQSQRRRRPLPPGDLLEPALRSRSPLPRPRPRLLRHPHQQQPPDAHPPAPTLGPRLQGHPRTRRITPPPPRTRLRRVLPLPSTHDFRISHSSVVSQPYECSK